MLYLGADHAGYRLKEFLKKHFDNKGIKYRDLGTHSEESVDYPSYAFKVGKAVASEKNAKGILICGTGTGMVMAANRIKGIRAAVAYDAYSAKMARHDNDANVLCLRGRKINMKEQARIADIWLKSKFSGIARHTRRIAKLK